MVLLPFLRNDKEIHIHKKWYVSKKKKNNNLNVIGPLLK